MESEKITHCACNTVDKTGQWKQERSSTANQRLSDHTEDSICNKHEDSICNKQRQAFGHLHKCSLRQQVEDKNLRTVQPCLC